MDTKKASTKILCKNCRIETNHTLEWIKPITRNCDDVIYGTDTHKVLSCNGCDEITYLTESKNSEDYFYINHEEAEFIITTTFYPARSYSLPELTEELRYIPPKISKFYSETINAYHNKQVILCSIGIRGIIESICLDANIKNNSLEEKINELQAQGLITSKLCSGLHESRIMGNSSAHRLESFNEEELINAVSLMNMLIKEYYLLPKHVETLQRRKKKNS